MLDVKKLIAKMLQKSVKFELGYNSSLPVTTERGQGVYDPTNGSVRIFFNLNGDTNISTNAVLLIVPAAYRPSGTVYGSMFARIGASGYAAFEFSLTSDGAIKQSISTSFRGAFGYIEYVI